MKLYISDGPESYAVQLVANELEIPLQLVHFDTASRSTSNGADFGAINPLFRAPALETDRGDGLVLTEATVISTYFADRDSEHRLIPVPGDHARAVHDQLLAFTSMRVAGPQCLLGRKLIAVKGIAGFEENLVAAYHALNSLLDDGRRYFMGDQLTVVDAHVWAAVRRLTATIRVGNLKSLRAYTSRMESLPSAARALRDGAMIAVGHKAFLAAD